MLDVIERYAVNLRALDGDVVAAQASLTDSEPWQLAADEADDVSDALVVDASELDPRQRGVRTLRLRVRELRSDIAAELGVAWPDPLHDDDPERAA